MGGIELVNRKLPHGIRGVDHAPRKQRVPLQFQESAFVDDVNVFKFFDDFADDTLATDQWTVAITEASMGTVLFTLGSTANDFGNLASAIQFSTSAPGRLDVRLRVTTGADAIDNLCVGLSDAKTESNGNLCTNAVTPAIVPDDALLFIYELANGGDLWYVGSANNTTDTATATTLTVGSTYQKLSICWNEDLSADYYINDILVGHIDNAYRTGRTLCAIVASTHVGGTGDPIITVDYVRVVQERV
jgi:hypothetical protein